MEDEVFQDMKVEVFVRLKFSYDSLSSDKVKSCFLYCSLFPEDFEIPKRGLVDYWICENFGDRNESYSIIGSLVGACLLEELGEYVKMHNVIRYMALWIACKCEKEKHGFFVEAGAQLTQVPEISDGFFQFMDALNVLDLFGTGIRELPMGISKLNSLQYLNLSGTLTRQLPIELKMLVNLKYLKLENTINLNMIPRGVISSLSSLQVLEMYNVGIFEVQKGEDNLLRKDNMLIEELQCLEHLNVLSITITSVSGLQSYVNTHTLPDCTRALSLRLFPGPQSLNIWWLANMKNLGFIYTVGRSDLGEPDVDVVMEEIETHDDAGGGLGNSMISRETCFNSLHTLMLGRKLRLTDLTSIILAPNLKYLFVGENKHIEEIISVEKLDDVQVGDENFNPFFKLEYLILDELPELKSIYPKVLSFPSLKRIEVYKCPQLKKLPLNSSSANGGKVKIEAEERWWKDVEWEDDSTKTTFLPCFVPSRHRY
ncbi:hypothetical protein GH714_028528 [Hevea brasiliensis]|uniref:NB-ARC domain-containing protein n=1 Tax=Hevea brasiliensis TaxID=3981 RepID=A0A6A6LPV2_HEVBR|nr:hypothetical protein GH714_028528 [Hevea brasiliensis]